MTSNYPKSIQRPSILNGAQRLEFAAQAVSDIEGLANHDLEDSTAVGLFAVPQAVALQAQMMKKVRLG